MASEVMSTVPAAFAQQKPTPRRRFAGSAFWAMAMKELREVRGIALIALGIFALLVTEMVKPSSISDFPGVDWIVHVNDKVSDIPFVTDNFVTSLFPYFFLLSIALGLRQTLGESVPGTYLFLLHRPAGRTWILGVKLLVGVSVYLLCGAMPILAYGIWGATHSLLFEWAMTLNAWLFWLSMVTTYLLAFLTGLRPARWFGTRLFPLAMLFVPLLIFNRGAEDLILEILGVLWFVTGAMALMAIFFVANHRDFS
jgi:hypothetical protein